MIGDCFQDLVNESSAWGSKRVTTHQLHLFNALGFAMFLVIALFTRPTARRIAGALAGGAAFGVAALGIIALGEKAGWWHMAITWQPYFLTLLWIDFALCAYIYLVSWRIARRFGWQGLAALAAVAAVIGPIRDYRYMARFPEWGAYAEGVGPILAISVTYMVMILLGHGVMRLVSGPANADRLARRPWAEGA